MGATPQQRTSLILPLGLAACLIGLVLLIWHLSRPHPHIAYLEQLSEEHQRLTAGYQPDRSRFPLPRLEQGLAELRYLEKLRTGMEAGGSCGGTKQKMVRLFSDYEAERGRSLYLPAASALARREGQDFVHRSSDSIRGMGGGPGFGLRARLRPRQPTDADKAIELLKKKKSQLRLVESSREELARILVATEKYLEECPDEAPVIEKVLGYFLRRTKN